MRGARTCTSHAPSSPPLPPFLGLIALTRTTVPELIKEARQDRATEHPDMPPIGWGSRFTHA